MLKALLGIERSLMLSIIPWWLNSVQWTEVATTFEMLVKDWQGVAKVS